MIIPRHPTHQKFGVLLMQKPTLLRGLLNNSLLCRILKNNLKIKSLILVWTILLFFAASSTFLFFSQPGLYSCLLDSSILHEHQIIDGSKLHLSIRKQGDGASSSEDPNEFFVQLRDFLRGHFSSQDAEKVMAKFKEVWYHWLLYHFLYSISNTCEEKNYFWAV